MSRQQLLRLHFRRRDTGTLTTITSGSTLTLYGSNCETAEEKAKAKAAEEKHAAEREKWNKEHPPLYSLWGGCSTEFEFSDDYKFIVPKPEPAAKPIYLNSTW
jgi:hypothetical protein